MADWLAFSTTDIATFVACALMLGAYHLFLHCKVRRNPAYTVQAVNVIARTAWVESVMAGGKDILAVQTLRNSTMAATFLASTAVLLTMGVLTLSGQGDKADSTWHVLNAVGATHSGIWLTKLLLMLLDLFIAFFSFSVSIRIYNHVGYMINVPLSAERKALSPRHVAIHLNRAGHFYSVGMRAYYFLVPLVFWLFGPHFMLLATAALIYVLYRLDRAPKVLEEDYS
jgi:Predicted membrane protein